jgi:thiol:disulfide interchange protein
MVEAPPLTSAQRIIALIFPALGALALAIGILLVFTTDGPSAWIFATLGSSVVLFAISVALIGHRLLDRRKTVPPDDHQTAQPAATNAELAAALGMTLGEILRAAHIAIPAPPPAITSDAARHPPG